MCVRACAGEVRVLEVALREKLFFIFLGVSTSLSLIWVVPRKRKFSFSLCPFSPFVNFFFLLHPLFFFLSFHLSLLLSFVVFPIHDGHLCFLSLSVSLLTITLFLKLSSNFFGFFPLFSFYSNWTLFRKLFQHGQSLSFFLSLIFMTFDGSKICVKWPSHVWPPQQPLKTESSFVERKIIGPERN